MTDWPQILADNSPMMLVIVLVFLVVYRLGEQVKKLADTVISSLNVNAQKYAASWAMGFLYATAASLQAMAEVATTLHWAYAAAAAKVLQPGVVAIIAYMNKSPEPTVAKPSTTTPPMP